MGKRGGKNRRKPEEEGEGDAQKHEPAAPSVELSQGGFQDKRKYRLDDDTASYYREIAKVLASQEAEDVEQRPMLVSNALGEALGASAQCVMRQSQALVPRFLISGGWTTM